MTVLDCFVTGCTYNRDCCCGKENIKVEGPEARNNSETCCSSFKEKGCGCASNVNKTAAKEVDVACEAVHCVFNTNCKCGAEHIGIAGGDVCKCTETECASFSCSC